MTTTELAKRWSMSVGDALKRLQDAGVFVLDVDSNLDQYAIRNIENKYGTIPSASQQKQPVVKVAVKKASQPSAPSSLDQYAREYSSIIHSTAIVSPVGGDFINKYSKLCQKHNRQLIVVESTLKVVTELYQGAGDELLRSRARTVIKQIWKLCEENHILLIPDNAPSEREAILSLIKGAMNSTDLLVITQDENLMKGAGIKIGANDTTGHTLRVQRISSDGNLIGVFSKENGFRFPKADRVTTLTNTPMDVGAIPGLNDTVYTKSGAAYTLSKQCGNPGTEGTVFKVNDKFAAKIYKQGIMNPRRLKKLERMSAESDYFCRGGICWPCDVLYNRQGKPVGYLMPLAADSKGRKTYELSTATNYIELIKAFPEWNREQIIQLCITILDKMVYLHNANVIMGDINTRNFLFADENTVFFVDCDSYQISEIPCPVGVDEYVAPEIHVAGGRYDVLRTMANENFAVATLVFMILMAGKRPYDLTDGEGVIKNIINADFAYPLGPDTNRRTPVGPYRYIWSNMPRFLKSMFYYTFRNPAHGNIADPKQSRYAPEKRPSSLEWKNSLSYYLKKLPLMMETDPNANALCPLEFKAVTRTCARCGEEVRASQLDNDNVCRNCRENTVKCKLCGMQKKAPSKYKNFSICQDCLDKEETYRCSRCGTIMTISKFQKHVLHKSKYEFCSNCAEQRNRVYVTKVCKSCGKSFQITYGEYDYFTSKGLHIPERCKECRKHGSVSSSNQPKPTPAKSASASISYNTGSGKSNSAMGILERLKKLLG